MTGVAAIALCAAFTSCSKSGDDVYNPEAAGQMKADQITQAYNEAFIKYVGGPIASNQDWGFGSAGTRVAAVNSNQWFDGVTEQFKHLVKPADVTAREEEVVSNWFKTNKNPTCDEILLTEFFVQQVYFGTKEYTTKDNNNAEHKVIGGQHMDYLYAGTVDNKDHINNFNTSAPKRTDTGLQNMQLMQNSSTANFGYHESYNSQNDRFYLVKNRNWVIKAISVDGVIGYYVGFDYESHGQNGEIDPDGYFDDRIVKIVPGTGYQIPPTHNYTLRVLGEDLTFGEDADADFDFNDVVFDVAIENGETWIKLQAAGGTLPLYIDTKEVHQLFGVNTTDMVNTGRMSRDAVEVKLDNYYSNAKDIPVTVTKNGTTVALKAEKGEPASKIAVPTSANFQWCAERVSMKQQYPLFIDWCTNNSFTSVWWAQ